ncbi:MAG TPA: hypothetical protein VJV78_19075 [Polyangiales bacterium]|nr:hypothetical protein [Polyangiales bacterium]
MLLAAASCERSAPVCRFGAEYRLFQSGAQVFHDLRTLSLGQGMLALFSDTSGVHVMPLDGQGAPQGPARRLFDACDGGLDADNGASVVHVACVRRGEPPRSAGDRLSSEGSRPSGASAPGEVVLYALDPKLAVRELARFGHAGRISTGIALARSDGGSLALAWHDAAVSGSRIWFVEPDRMRDPRQLSDDGWEASAPSLARHAGRLYACWAETRFNGERAESRIRVVAVGSNEAGRVVLSSRDPAPSPRLAAAPDGLILSFRDKRESLRKTGLYLARVDATGRLKGQVVRAGRADGQASPVLEPCLGGVVSATPRTFAGDYFVGVTRADTELRRLSREQQFYEDSREFDRVAVHCERDQAVLLIGERGRLLRGSAALRSTTFRCD